MPVAPALSIEIASRHQAHLERLKTGDVREYRELFAAMERDILGRLAGDVTEWSRVRLEGQLAAIQTAMRAQYSGEMLRQWRDQIGELAAYEAGFELRALEQVAPTYNFTLPSDTQIVAAVYSQPLQVRGSDGGKLLEAFYSDWTDAGTQQVVGTIRRGFAQGQTTPEIVRELRGIGGVFERNRRGFETLTRTALQHAAMTAREQTWQANDDIVTGVRWTSTLDNRTSTQCRSLDGQVFPINSGPRPPAHPSCRSSTVAVLDERFSILEEGATRRTRDPETGDVDYIGARTTYYQWLKRQPAEVQNSIIGPTRGKLLRDGGLSAQRFAELQLDRRFMPLTLREMRELDPVAFSRAGIEV